MLLLAMQPRKLNRGWNVGRMISLMSLDTEKVPGMTVNRYCSSGLETIAIATAKIKSGMADCIIAGGVECMSPIPFVDGELLPMPEWLKNHPDWYWGMGLTAEAVAREYKVSRGRTGSICIHFSQMRAINALDKGYFKDGIAPIEVEEVYLDEQEKRQVRKYTVDTDEGPRADTTMEAIGKVTPGV